MANEMLPQYYYYHYCNYSSCSAMSRETTNSSNVSMTLHMVMKDTGITLKATRGLFFNLK